MRRVCEEPHCHVPSNTSLGFEPSMRAIAEKDRKDGGSPPARPLRDARRS